MAKRWSANSLVGQVLLICLVGTNVEVLGQMAKNTPPIRRPNQPGLQPTVTQQNPQIQPDVKPSYPGQNPQTNFQPGGNPSYPGQNPQTNFQPGGNPSYPGLNPQTNFQPGGRPSYPGQNPQTNVQPGGNPSYPGQNPQTNVQPGGKPSYPGQNPQTNFQPGGRPSYPGQNPQTNFQPGGRPSYPGQNPQTNFQPGGRPSYPGQNPQTNFQPGGNPSYPGQNPQTNVQPGSQSSYTQNRRPTTFQPTPMQKLYHDSNSQMSGPRKPQQPQQEPKYPMYPQPPQVPKYPTHPQTPQEPKNPMLPQIPQEPKNPQPPQVPKHPMLPQIPQEPKNPQPPQEPTHPQTQQNPKNPQLPKRRLPSQQVKVPETPVVQFCGVEHNVRIQCGGHDISAAGCEAIDCCFADHQCFYGKAVTVQATKDAQFIVVVAKDATLPNLDIDTISLIGEGRSCTAVDSNSEFVIFQFAVTDCGSVVREEPGVITYTNWMTSSYEVGFGPSGSITRDSIFELLFQARYTGTSIETVIIEVFPLQDPPLPVAALGPIRVQLRLANGECSSKGCNEVEAAYNSFYTEADYPVTKVLRDPVYVEVQLIEKTDPNLVLTLGRCWVTNSPNSHHLPQWDLLIDGCPYSDDRYLSSLVPVGPSSGLPFPTHYRRFIFKMFTFVDSHSLEPLKEEVYIHCSTTVCTPGEGRVCEPSCHRTKREAEASHQTRSEQKLVVTVGPVTMVDHSRSDTS
ncbi:zona pellucida sperm-binding protein 1 isoform X2 [Pleuronectes platessa]|uniref:zona pellucida sperm-binding protein 1 isoform X2 n=1 Tax=Pleuronectes platessa TaxID=8262 RepID=UPI00232A1D1B|nr:zona pellucida sperm-binding protein 1 isoform X2 [Pleuronectes platessa]